jgi:hypothetical protein
MTVFNFSLYKILVIVISVSTYLFLRPPGRGLYKQLVATGGRVRESVLKVHQGMRSRWIDCNFMKSPGPIQYDNPYFLRPASDNPPNPYLDDECEEIFDFGEFGENSNASPDRNASREVIGSSERNSNSASGNGNDNDNAQEGNENVKNGGGGALQVDGVGQGGNVDIDALFADPEVDKPSVGDDQYFEAVRVRRAERQAATAGNINQNRTGENVGTNFPGSSSGTTIPTVKNPSSANDMQNANNVHASTGHASAGHASTGPPREKVHQLPFNVLAEYLPVHELTERVQAAIDPGIVSATGVVSNLYSRPIYLLFWK